MRVLNILLSILAQVVSTVGVVVVVGLVIAQCNKCFYGAFGGATRVVAVCTGFIGTPIHEISHAIMCIIFGHKITKIKLFSTGADGVLGYVQNSYNPKNPYHKMGNFFIGLAPIFVGAAVMLLLMWLLVPSAFYGVFSSISSVNGFSFSGIFSAIKDMLYAMFAPENFADFRWWIYMVFGLLISIHMTLSTADIKIGASGCLLVLGLMSIITIIVGIISESALNIYTAAITNFGACLFVLLVVALLFSFITALIGGIIRLFSRRRR